MYDILHAFLCLCLWIPWRWSYQLFHSTNMKSELWDSELSLFLSLLPPTLHHLNFLYVYVYKKS